MDHGEPTTWAKEKSEEYKKKLGLINFAVYTAIYFVFIIISVINPKMLSIDIGGLNLAIVYGFGLIILAIILALIYNHMCSRKEKLDNDSEIVKGESK